jgi:nitrile hydratase accessory protein
MRGVSVMNDKLCESEAVEGLLAYLPEDVSVPRKNGELNFQEPWESRAFGMAIALYEQERYTSWDDFRDRLISQISTWENAEPDGEQIWNYYDHWMGALEQLVVHKGLLDPDEIEARANQFLHGQRDEFF